ncbi:MAG TPA: branched-chain amino acid ABC transporter permease [Candidatus Merdibacter merdavium]|uniref:Branched-chain amino acid ABC transporter permease n=1 Tax=Candidatus Merdibacter merdavium TaxID=2838692 RepID=A0A9D2SUU5_9FIRM|nr:branched-chain amino acid ABC transporter permease [Candidatus Merdibacter merdavium]
MKRYFSKTNLCWIALSAIAFILVSVLINIGLLGSYYQITLYNICINIILAVSLNLIIGICGQFSLGHAGFMCIGAYSAAILVKSMPNMGGFAIGIVIGLVISAIAALIVSIPTLRLRGDYLAIATLGFSEIIRIIVLNMEITNGAAGITGIPQLTSWLLLFIVMVLSIIIVTNFGRSRQGRACISIREDEIASEAMGVNTTKYKTMAFVIGAMLASVAGALYACNFFVIQPDLFNFNKSIDILVMVVFGGMGSITGSLIAAIFIGILNTVLQSFSSIRMIIYGLALVGIMIFRPGGLLGTKEFTFSALLRRFKKKGGMKR